jgi:hypothetical protein
VSALRLASVWAAAAVLVVCGSAFLISLTFMQLTAEDTGERILRRSTASLTDIDASLPKIEDDLHALAEDSSGPTVQVPGYPITVTLSRDEARTIGGEELRDRLLDRSAQLIYDHGMSVWTGSDPDADRNIERLSAAGLVDRGLGLVRGSTHTVFLVLTIVFGLLTLAFGAGLWAILPRDGRLLTIGGVTVAGSLPLLAAAVAMRFAFRTAEADGDPFIEALLDIGADSTWVPIRNFFTLSLLGMGLLGLGSALIWWEARQQSGEEGHLADTSY